MPPRDNDPAVDDAAALIRRAAELARADQVANVFARMDDDDRRDEGDSFDDEATPSSAASDMESLGEETSDSPSKGTLQEQDFSVDSTIELPDGSDPEGSEPGLAGPSLSSNRAASSRSTLIATPLFRPTRRPPMAVLRVFDDDQIEHQSVRVRQTPFIVGRQDGDLIVGHERQMSRRHARIDRVQEGDVWRWYLGDLRSTNGTFVRVSRVQLDDGVEVLLAGELVRFVHPAGGKPALVRVAPSTDEERQALEPGSHYIGTDPKVCLPFLRDSPYLDPQHLRVEYSKGHWQVVDLASTNHLWVAITKRTELTSGTLFQIGEQRFAFHLP